MKAAASTPSRPAARREVPAREVSIAEKLARAVRNSLNLPRLRVDVHRSRTLKCWQVRVGSGARTSDWITLDARTLGVMAKLGLLPPKYLGTFRLAYDAIGKKK